MMRKYFAMKENYPDCLLFFRLGDFYEMFFKDAEIASRILDLTLTGRNCGLEERAPMCGVPYHAVDTYIRKLIEAGQRVAICEQLNDPSTATGMLDRDVVRVVSPGTVMEEEILDEKSSNYLASVFTEGNGFGLAWADISTGEFNVFEYDGKDADARLGDLLSAINPVRFCQMRLSLQSISASITSSPTKNVPSVITTMHTDMLLQQRNFVPH